MMPFLRTRTIFGRKIVQTKKLQPNVDSSVHKCCKESGYISVELKINCGEVEQPAIAFYAESQSAETQRELQSTVGGWRNDDTTSAKPAALTNGGTESYSLSDKPSLAPNQFE